MLIMVEIPLSPFDVISSLKSIEAFVWILLIVLPGSIMAMSKKHTVITHILKPKKSIEKGICFFLEILFQGITIATLSFMLCLSLIIIAITTFYVFNLQFDIEYGYALVILTLVCTWIFAIIRKISKDGLSRLIDKVPVFAFVAFSLAILLIVKDLKSTILLMALYGIYWLATYRPIAKSKNVVYYITPIAVIFAFLVVIQPFSPNLNLTSSIINSTSVPLVVELTFTNLGSNQIRINQIALSPGHTFFIENFSGITLNSFETIKLTAKYSTTQSDKKFKVHIYSMENGGLFPKVFTVDLKKE